MIDWSEKVGAPIRTWRLDTFLGVRDGKAYFMTRDETSQPLLVHIIDAASERAESMLESWTRTRDLDGGGLLRPRACGRDYIDLEPVNYAITALPEDDLSEILSKRPLGHDEAVHVFTAIAAALDYLHQRGLSHGSVTPANFYFVKGEIHLSADSIAPASLAAKQSDLRQYGATLSHSLARLDPPFAEVIKACAAASDSGLTAAEIITRLSQPPPLRQPRINAIRRFGLPVAAIAVALSIFVLVRRHSEEPVQPVPKAAIPSLPQSTTAPKPTPFAPPPGAGMSERSIRPNLNDKSWAVIAAAYRDYASAQKRATSMKRQWPHWQPHVSPRDGQGQIYFVVIGSGLSRDAADQMRATALSQGAPKDTYVTKLDES